VADMENESLSAYLLSKNRVMLVLPEPDGAVRIMSLPDEVMNKKITKAKLTDDSNNNFSPLNFNNWCKSDNNWALKLYRSFSTESIFMAGN
jgi:hypothetical protein